MPFILLRLVIIAGGLACLWKIADSVQTSLSRAAEVAHDTVTPFTLLAAGILVAACAYAFGQLHR